MKKQGWHLLLTVALTALMALGAAGCKQAKTQSAPIKITYWHRMTGSYNTALQHEIKAFNRSQSKYRVVGVSQGSYDALQEKIMAAAKSKTLPVMAQAPYTNIGDYVKAGFLTSFDANMLHGDAKLTAKQRADLYPSFLSTGKYQGKYYGLPFSVSTSVLFYNQTLMKKYGIAMPHTWADIEAAGKKVQAAKLAAVALDQSYDVTLEGMAQQAGAKEITASGKVNLGQPAVIDAAAKLLALRKAGILTTAGSDGYFTTDFVNQKTLFAIGSSASIPVLEQQAPKSLAWGTATIPAYAGHTGTPLNGNENVLFKTASKAQQRGAWLFSKFLMQGKQTAYWAAKTGYVPVAKSGTASATYQAYLKQHPAYQAAVDAVPASFGSTVFPGYTDYRNDLMDTVDSTLTKHVSAKAAFTKLAKQTEQIIAAQ